MKDLSRLMLALICLAVSAGSQPPAPASGVDLTAIDKGVDPCRDFFHYACGNWIKANPIPAKYPRWGRFNELRDRNQEVLHQILEVSAKNQNHPGIDQKIGAFYQSCMDETAIEK